MSDSPNDPVVKPPAASPKDSWPLAIADIALKVLVPVVIVFVGVLLSKGEKEAIKAERLAAQQQRELQIVFQTIEKLASDNSSERVITLKVLNKYAEERKLPSALFDVVVESAQNDPSAEVAKAASETVSTIASVSERGAAAGPTPENPDAPPTSAPVSKEELTKARVLLNELPPRIYFHIRSEDQRRAAEGLEKTLEAGNYVVPGIERLAVGPSESELRYFRQSERPTAEEILGAINARGFNVKAKYVAGHEDSKAMRPRHFELWLDPGFGRGAASAGTATTPARTPPSPTP